MDRRAFLSLLAGAILDPERLLWEPGRKSISIPKLRLEPRIAAMSGWMEEVNDGVMLIIGAYGHGSSLSVTRFGWTNLTLPYGIAPASCSAQK